MFVCACATRSLWDHNVVAPKLVVKIDEQTEVFQYSTPSIPPLTKRDHCILRWVERERVRACVCACVVCCSYVAFNELHVLYH